MNFKVGDEIIIIQDTKSHLWNNCIGFRGFIINLKNENNGIPDDRFKVEITGILPIYWNIHPEDMRKLSKLEKAMK